MQVQAHVTKATLSQARVDDIRCKLAQDLGPQIAAVERELADIESMAADWRTTSADVHTAERVADDRARLERRLRMLQDARTQAEADLRLALAQVEVDSLAEIRAEIDRIGAERAATARNVIAAAEQLAALIGMHDLQRQQMIRAATRTARFMDIATHRALIQGLNAVNIQGAVEAVIARNTDPSLWADESRGARGAVLDLVATSEREHRYTLISLDRCAQQLVEAAKQPTQEAA